ncbi:hypothetical protein [Chryseobacterium sp. HMWF035]|uniref:hypothetical protein n=1 Tax=Chryseobacterium sp. HMWF035 TaxID=2056868 RepID=UPI000D565CA8|nr:hypothetical protein [Chryseobacterium sp. HMWF035]PVV55534.1 hypothetical protein DD829_14335 [Chryseobacterium sp. HMWF035]
MVIGIIYKLVLLLVTIKSYILSRKLGLSAQNYLLIYLLTSLFTDVFSFSLYLIYPDSKNGLLYNFYDIFSIIFFYIYFSKVLTSGYKIWSSLITFFAVILILVFTNFFNFNFDKNIGIILLSFYIIHSLLWFYQKLSFFDETPITNDPSFWISTSLLMWSCFFVFRVTPMFYFANEDEKFLQFLRDGQNIINIIMYVMFYVALMKFKINNS